MGPCPLSAISPRPSFALQTKHFLDISDYAFPINPPSTSNLPGIPSREMPVINTNFIIYHLLYPSHSIILNTSQNVIHL